MKKKLTVLVFAATMLAGPSAWADEYSDTVDVYKNAGESGAFFNECYGYAVFPTIGKEAWGSVPRTATAESTKRASTSPTPQ